ncbi:hypothetical protein [Arthrobacter sp. NPDC058127]|uniref:hypothetical protein n=1 Tax=Arthrobacter sp. NPDC058127 TaxID=3346351 RepID=UPI0036EE3510
MRIHYSSLQARAVCFRIGTQFKPARKTPATLVLLTELGRYVSRSGADRWTAGESDEYGLRLKPVPLINDLLDESVLLFEDLVAKTDWPGTVDETQRIRRHDPGEYWMYYTPKVCQLSRLYGLEPTTR